MKRFFTNTLLLIAFAFIMATPAAKAAVESRDFTFSTSPKLEMTRYSDPTVAAPESGRPCIIFAFGGSFTHGERNDPRYLPYFRFMAERGYTVCTIDYRTTLAGFNPANGVQAFGTALVEAVNTATVDFLSATGYVATNAADWGIDPAKIIASGSSAGAITALQSAYTVSHSAPAGFPEGFNYAAAVTFAGAILTQGAPVIDGKMCPVMMFQGDADRQVPYNSLVLGPIGLYGSNYLANAIKDAGGAGAFWSVLGAGHEMALDPMTENLYDIAGFLYHVLSDGKKQFARTTVTVPGTPPYQSVFSIADYIKANMPAAK